MATPLNTAKDSIKTVVEALTPPTRTNIPYRYVDTRRYIPDGSSAHRYFAFRPLGGGEIQQFGLTNAQYEHSFELVMVFTTSHTTLDSVFEEITNEAVLIARAINKATSWGSGVDFVRCDEYEIEEVDSEDFYVVLKLRSQTMEQD